MKCGKCGTASPSGKKFCEDCGTGLSIKCLACGADNAPDARFCENCGKPMEETPAAASPEQKIDPVELDHGPEEIVNIAPMPRRSQEDMAPPPAVIATPSAVEIAPQRPQSVAPAPMPVSRPVPVAARAEMPAPVARKRIAPPEEPRTGGVGLLFGVVVLIVIGVAGYFLKQPVSVPSIAVASAPSAAIAAPPSVAAAPAPDAAETPAAAPAEIAAKLGRLLPAVGEALSLYPVKEITPRVEDILAAARSGNEAAIAQAVEAMKQLALPARGDRKTARKANTDGLAALQRESYNEAIVALTAAVMADPADQEIINNLSFALEFGRHLPEARTAALCTVALAPTRASGWVSLATTMASQGETDRAVTAFTLAYRFSQDQQKAVAYLQDLVNKHTEPLVRETAATALQQLGK